MFLKAAFAILKPVSISGPIKSNVSFDTRPGSIKFKYFHLLLSLPRVELTMPDQTVVLYANLVLMFGGESLVRYLFPFWAIKYILLNTSTNCFCESILI
jgi:hypothetical protein